MTPAPTAVVEVLPVLSADGGPSELAEGASECPGSLSGETAYLLSSGISALGLAAPQRDELGMRLERLECDARAEDAELELLLSSANGDEADLQSLLQEALALYRPGATPVGAEANPVLSALQGAVPLSENAGAGTGAGGNGVCLSLGFGHGLRVNLGMLSPSYCGSPSMSPAVSQPVTPRPPPPASPTSPQAPSSLRQSIPAPESLSEAPASTVMSMSGSMIGEGLAMAFGSSAPDRPPVPPRREIEDISDTSDMLVGGNTARTDSVYAFNESRGSSRGNGILDFGLDGGSLQLDMQSLLSMGMSDTNVARLSEAEARLLPQSLYEADECHNCSICLENIRRGAQLSTLPCGHAFHTECLVQWVTRAAICPNCRATVEPARSRSPAEEVEEILGDVALTDITFS
eukprot:TRINITY_DN84535_c0_g1_i1.p1 TRINITY_DN84535_c0_g1~~TRINITY_DN84535_c0_g1_i1.p1  ORF type:complete len:405 (+),score=52.60 TRINITY_DN84535_c0_g1_i1:46-1260(+)